MSREQVAAVLSLGCALFIHPPLASADDHSNSSSGATRISTSGSSTSGRIDTRGDVDYFRFSANSGCRYTIRTGGSIDTVLHLYGTNGTTELAYNDDDGSSLLSRITWTAPSSGTYFVKVRHFSSSGTGSYSVSLSESNCSGGGGGTGEPANNSPSGAAQLTTSGSSVSGRIDSGGDVDYYRFSANSGCQYRIATGGSIDTYLHLYGTNGSTELASDDDSGPDALSLITWSATSSGTYYVKVRHFSSSGTGSYSVSVSESNCSGGGGGGGGGSGEPANNSPSGAAQLTTSGSSVSGRIDSGGDVDYYRFSANSGCQYRIATGGSIDTYLHLYGTNGSTELASDDDSGPGMLSLITWTAPSSGTYYVKVRHYSNSGTGDYSASISQASCGIAINDASLDRLIVDMVSRAGGTALANEYSQGRKWYLAIGASRGAGAVSGELVIYIDAADLLRITPEGINNDWVTCYVDAGVSAVSISLWDFVPSLTPILGVTRQQFSSGLEDPRREGNCSLGNLTTPFFNVTCLRLDEQGAVDLGCQNGGDQFMVDASAGIISCSIPLSGLDSELNGTVLRSAIRQTVSSSLTIGVVSGAAMGDMVNALINSIVQGGTNGQLQFRSALRQARTPNDSNGGEEPVRDDHGNTYDRATSLGIVFGLSSSRPGRIDPAGDLDYFSFQATGGWSYTIETGGDIDTYLDLYDTDGTSQLAADDDSGPGTLSRIYYTANGFGVRTYYLRVRHYSSSGTGNYSVSVRGSMYGSDILGTGVNEPANNSPSGAVQITTDGAAVSGQIEIGRDVDYYQFAATAGCEYTIQTTGSIDTFLLLYDTDGTTQLAYNDDVGSSQLSRIVWTAPSSGAYYFKVRHYIGSGTGDYGVAVSRGGCGG